MIANFISLIRILSIPFFVGTLLYYTPQKDFLRIIAFFIFLFAMLTDVIDGFIARKIDKKSEIGAILDPLSDKLLLMSAFFCLYLLKSLPLRIPLWFLILVVSRDLIILMGTGIMFLLGIRFKIVPTLWGKLTTFFQMLTVICVLLKFKFSFLVWYIASVFTIISGVDYIRKGLKLINNANKADINNN